MQKTSQPLEIVDGITSESILALGDIGVYDAEHLAGLFADDDTTVSLTEYLGLSPDSVAQVRASLKNLVGELRVADTEDLGLGALAPEEGRRRIKPVADKDTPALPPAIDLRAGFRAVRSQGPRGTCVSFAMTALHEYKRDPAVWPDLSEQYLYWRMKKLDGKAKACGSWLWAAARAMKGFGECSEATLPYISQLPCNNHGSIPGSAIQEAGGLRRGFAKVRISAADLRKTLALGRPVAIAIPVWKSWYTSPTVFQTGRINMRVGKEKAVGGHALAVAGYRNGPEKGGGVFIVRNSWGPGWAYDGEFGPGYGTIPYAYINAYCWEAMTT